MINFITKEEGMRMKMSWFVALAFVVASGTVFADKVTGCPLGLNGGEFWLRTSASYNSISRALWKENQQDEPTMMAIPEDWHGDIVTTTTRLGYGITDRLNIGMLLTYIDKDVKMEKWSGASRVWKEIDGHGFGDVWFSAAYKLYMNDEGDHTHTVAVALSADAADDPLVKQGIGSGANAVRFALLNHNPIPGGIHLCSHIIYDYYGEARTIDGWGKSGYNLGDRIDYKANFERELPFDERFGVEIGAFGWYKLEDTDADGETVEKSERFDHAVALKLTFAPGAKDVTDRISFLASEHRKMFVSLRIPYMNRKDLAATVTPSVMFMWTF